MDLFKVLDVVDIVCNYCEKLDVLCEVEVEKVLLQICGGGDFEEIMYCLSWLLVNKIMYVFIIQLKYVAENGCSD